MRRRYVFWQYRYPPPENLSATAESTYSGPVWGRRRDRRPKWIPNQDLEDSVLAWRAVEPMLSKRLYRIKFSDVWLGQGGGGGGYSRGLFGSQGAEGLRQVYANLPDEATRRTAGRVGAYEIGCLELSKRLNDQERVTLRATGELPDWFRPELEQQVATMTKGSKKRRTSN